MPSLCEERAPPAPEPTEYVELWARSSFSFLQAASLPEEIVRVGAELGHGAISVCDRDGLYGIVRAWEECKRTGLRLVVGCEVTLSEGPTILLHVANHKGYSNLCRILTESHRRHPKGKPRDEEGVPRNLYAGIPLDYVCAHEGGLWATATFGCTHEHVQALVAAFGPRTSLAARRHLDGDDAACQAWAEELSLELGVPIVATNAVRYAQRGSKLLYDVIHCIREGTTLDSAGRALSPNTEACLKSPREMRRVFADRPAWLARSIAIADACRFSLKELKYRFPSELESPRFPGETPDQALAALAFEGARARYPDGIPPRVQDQIEKELSLIAKLDVAPYFLSVRSIVDIARRRDILCQGRGSAANSAVCFCLGITAVDPARSNLLFERFLSAERNEPPDIDVDFEHERREEVIQELYEKYGRDRAAMVSEIITYRGKSALREVGKVFGLSLEQVERLSGIVTHYDPKDAATLGRLRDAGFDANDARIRQVLTLSQALYGTPRHLSIHVGGFVLASLPLVDVAPIEPATMPGRTVIPWDKDDLDTLGFFKVDVLGLGMLTAIRKALEMIADATATRELGAIDRLARIPPEDPVVYDALCKADTVGVFQIESRAQMAMLPRLLPRKFYDLVVEVAIVRPGPIQGGMVHPYLRRRNGEEPAVCPHPLLEPILERTLGVPLFQEQVMQIAIVGAGYTGGEADQLRRDMAAWRKNGRLQRHRERLLSGFRVRGIPEEFGERLYAQIQGFGEYGFPESHAASFALLVYASSWIKVHHPAAFAAALVNSQPMGFYSPSTILQDAQRHGVVVRSPSIDKSDWDCTLEGANVVRVGLRQVKGLGEESGRRIEAARSGGRPFLSIEDLADRAVLKKNELEALAEAGALDPIASTDNRREAMWKVRAPRAEGLFAGLDGEGPPPALPKLTRAEQLVLDYERTGLSVSDHPMRVVRPVLPRGTKTAKDLFALPHGARVSAAGLVICRQRPMTASGVVFVTMEDETGFINLVLWAKVFDRLRHVATTSSLMMAHGKIERSGDVVYIVVQRLERVRMTAAQRPVPSMSRDFH